MQICSAQMRRAGGAQTRDEEKARARESAEQIKERGAIARGKMARLRYMVVGGRGGYAVWAGTKEHAVEGCWHGRAGRRVWWMICVLLARVKEEKRMRKDDAYLIE